MKKYLLILFLCILPVLAFGDAALIGEVEQTIPSGGPDAWYYSAGSDSYANTQWTPNTIYRCSAITIGAGGSLTKVGVKVTDDNTTNVKIGLYDSANDLHECNTVATAGNAWLDVTLSSPLSVNTNDVVIAGFIQEVNEDSGFGSNDATEETQVASTTYGDQCQATITANTDGMEVAVRVYVD